MIKRLTFLALALCLTLAGCKKDDPAWTPVKLKITETTTAPQRDLAIEIEGGSGDYSVGISDPAVADVRVVVPDVGFPILEIETRQEGEAVITVTDTKSGLVDRCKLKVRNILSTIRIGYIRTHIDADRKEAIEDDLNKNALLAVGDRIIITQGTTWTFLDANKAEIARGTFSDEGEITRWNPVFSFLPIDNQIYTMRKFVFERDNGDRWEYDTYVVRDSFTRLNLRFDHTRFYEDLTKYYQTQYPEAGVRSVARVLISDKYY
jgi:hypothetical protein